MLDALAITEEEAAGLAELAAMDLAMARDFAARARAAEDPEVANDLVRSYQRMARSYRQSLALKMRLAREIARAERDAPPPPRDEARIHSRVEEVRSAVGRVIWTEYERSDSATDELRAEMVGVLDERLNLLALDDRFADPDLDAQVAATCRALSLDPLIARRWHDLPEPPNEAPPEPAHEPLWRGSG
jgi:hypothetical protein